MRRVIIQHPLAHELYQYHLGPRFDPGAQAEVLNPRFQLPEILFRGAARLAGSLSKFQPPQVWFRQQRGLVGLGGLQTGQIILQPLIDPSTQTYFEGV